MARRLSKAGCTDACRFGTRCIAILCWACTAPALAALYDGGLGYLLSYDSNASRSSANPRPVWTGQLFGGLAYEERSPELYARLLSQVERRSFSNTYSDDMGFFFDGAAVWTISPRQFTWSVEDVAREANLSLVSPDTPNNRAKTNSFSTGPELTLNISPTDIPVLGARYGRYDVRGVTTTEGLGDTQRGTVYSRWLHLVSTETTLSLNFAATRIHIDPPALFTDLSREDLFFRYESLSPFNRHTVDVGSTRIAQYGGQELTGRLARYAAQRSLTPDSVLRVLLADQISDTYSDTVGVFSIASMPAIQDAGAVPPLGAANSAAGNVYRSQRGEITYAKRSEPIGFSLLGYGRRVNYVDPTAPDYGEHGARFSLSWVVSLEAQPYAFLDYTKRNFPLSGEENIDRSIRVGVSSRLSRSFTVSLEAGQDERQSNVPDASFVNRRATLLLGYSTGPLYSARSRR